MPETNDQSNNSQNSRRHSVDASIYSGTHQISSNRNLANNNTGQPNPSDILAQQIQGNMNVTQASAAALFIAAQQQAQASQSMGMMGGNLSNGQQTAAANAAAAAAAALLFPQQQQQQQQQFQQQTSDNQQKNNQNNLSLSNELKFLQQLQMEVGGQNTNALLLPSSNRSNDGHVAFLQSVLDQKVRNPRFDNPLAQAMMGLGGMNIGLLQNNYLNEARLLMQHGQLSPQLIMQNHMSNTQGNSFPQQSLQNSDMPLPSPHALFHRDGSKRMRGGVIEPFPEKLHRLLTEVESAGRSDVISFVASGRAFAIHKPDNFFKEIVPLYFRQSRLSSFKRQLNLYGFELINTGPARGGYFHELFVKDQPDLCRRMRRVAVKVTSSCTNKNEDGELEKEIDPTTRETKEKQTTNSVE